MSEGVRITTIEQGKNTVGTRTVTHFHLLSGPLRHRSGTRKGPLRTHEKRYGTARRPKGAVPRGKHRTQADSVSRSPRAGAAFRLPPDLAAIRFRRLSAGRTYRSAPTTLVPGHRLPPEERVGPDAVGPDHAAEHHKLTPRCVGGLEGEGGPVGPVREVLLGKRLTAAVTHQAQDVAAVRSRAIGRHHWYVRETAWSSQLSPWAPAADLEVRSCGGGVPSRRTKAGSSGAPRKQGSHQHRTDGSSGQVRLSFSKSPNRPLAERWRRHHNQHAVLGLRAPDENPPRLGPVRRIIGCRGGRSGSRGGVGSDVHYPRAAK